jgi:hypothetical protein
LELIRSNDSYLHGNCDATGSCPMATVFAHFSPNRGITMSAVNSLLAEFPEERPENSRYFTRIIAASRRSLLPPLRSGNLPPTLASSNRPQSKPSRHLTHDRD